MGAAKILKPERISLKHSQYHERWLQDLIEEDPTMLGIGDLRVLSRERRQSSGGRIDFLMIDDDSNVMYEVEIMLGKLDESHIIRTIEYWDIERRKYPNIEHVAVIVAEDITNRFFNVISLINRSIPIMALQLDALQLPEGIVLNFTKVLDTYEQPEIEDTEAQEETNRAYWDKKASSDAMATYDTFVALMREQGLEVKETFNKGHIALSTPRRSFCHPHPRKSAHCRVDLRVGEENLETALSIFEELAIPTTTKRKGKVVSFSLSKKEIKNYNEQIIRLIKMAYEFCS